MRWVRHTLVFPRLARKSRICTNMRALNVIIVLVESILVSCVI